MSNIKCTNCNNLVPYDSTFCSFCGNKIEAPKNETPCPKCNNFVPSDSKFCPFCGISIYNDADCLGNDSPQETISCYQNKINSNNMHYNVSKSGSGHYKKVAKNIKISKDEEIIMIGDIKKGFPSIRFYFFSLCYYVFCFLLFYFTHRIDEPQYNHISEVTINAHTDYYFLGLIHYRSYSRREDYYFWGALLLIALICILFALVPYWIYKRKCKNISQSELVLTNQNIYYYFPKSTTIYTIPLEKIKHIDCSPSHWFLDTSKISINLTEPVDLSVNEYLTTFEKLMVEGLSNAHEFIQSSINAAQNKTA